MVFNTWQEEKFLRKISTISIVLLKLLIIPAYLYFIYSIKFPWLHLLLLLENIKKQFIVLNSRSLLFSELLQRNHSWTNDHLT